MKETLAAILMTALIFVIVGRRAYIVGHYYWNPITRRYFLCEFKHRGFFHFRRGGKGSFRWDEEGQDNLGDEAKYVVVDGEGWYVVCEVHVLPIKGRADLKYHPDDMAYKAAERAKTEAVEKLRNWIQSGAQAEILNCGLSNVMLSVEDFCRENGFDLRSKMSCTRQQDGATVASVEREYQSTRFPAEI